MEFLSGIIKAAAEIGIKPNQGLVLLPKVTTVPVIHWCKHYTFFHGPYKGEVIPDGSACCFRHWIGLPTRWGQRHPYYTWQEDAIDDWYNYNYFFELKPPKVGATELYLGLAIHTALIDDDWKNGQVAIVVGTGANEAEKMIGRCKEMLEEKTEYGYGTGIYKFPINEDYNTKKEFSVRNVEFRAHPANNVDSIRSQPNMRLILVDEGSFFTTVDQAKVREAFEHYIGGSSTKIVLISTAGDVPEGFMYDIEREDPSIYKKYIFDYHVGLEVHPESFTSLYNKDMLDEAKKLPSFQRNFLHQWGHGSGDVFEQVAITRSVKVYPLVANPACYVECDVDPGYGSSKFAILIWQKINGKMQILYAAEYTRTSVTSMLVLLRELFKEFHVQTLRIDASAPELIQEFSNEIPTIGQSFRDTGLKMLSDIAQMVSKDLVEIHPQFELLLQQIRAARRDGTKGDLDKKIASFDLVDTLRMGSVGYQSGQGYSAKTTYSSSTRYGYGDDEDDV